MKLTVLGKYGTFPQGGGSCPAYLIEDGDTVILVELGSGTYARLLEYYPLDKINAIVISHLHADHCSDLGIMRYALEQKQYGDTKPLLISPKPREAALFDHVRARDGLEMDIGSINIKLFAVRHSVECYGIRFTNREGKLICYTADTGFFNGLLPHIYGADILLCGTNFIAQGTGNHMSAREAGRLAERGQVKRLLCTHIPGAGIDEELLLKNTGVDYAEVVQERHSYEV